MLTAQGKLAAAEYISKMFFTGTLQEGISTAVQQGKLVVCFVTDNNEESQKWENEFLKEDAVSSALAKEGVTLRLEAGSK